MTDRTSADGLQAALEAHEQNLLALGRTMLDPRPENWSEVLGERIAAAVNGITAVRAALHDHSDSAEEHCCNDPEHMSPEYLAALRAPSEGTPDRADRLTEAEEDTVIEARRAIRDGNAFDTARLLDIIERLATPDRADLVTDHHAADPHWHDPDGVTLHYATPDRADHSDSGDIDVERLARAMHDADPLHADDGGDNPPFDECDYRDEHDDFAAAIAAEYARSTPRTETPERAEERAKGWPMPDHQDEMGG